MSNLGRSRLNGRGTQFHRRHPLQRLARASVSTRPDRLESPGRHGRFARVLGRRLSPAVAFVALVVVVASSTVPPIMPSSAIFVASMRWPLFRLNVLGLVIVSLLLLSSSSSFSAPGRGVGDLLDDVRARALLVVSRARVVEFRGAVRGITAVLMTASTLAARLSVLVEDGTRRPVSVADVHVADKITTLSATCTLATSIFLSITMSIGSDWRRGHIDGVGRSSHSLVEARGRLVVL